MSENTFFRVCLYFTGILTIFIWSLLTWNHFHGGVPSHHVFAREDLPEISNWWGGLLIPLLSWFLLYRIQKRLIHNSDKNPKVFNLPVSVIYGFLSTLIFGILLSVFFTLGYSDIPVYMLLGVFVLALVFPIYRSECLLGFVIGMTYTFGAVLPTGIGSILVLIGAVLHLFVRPLILFVTTRLINLATSIKQNKAK